MDAPDSKDQEAQAARKSELDGYEAQFGKYVREYGPLNMVHLTVGVQGFSVFWEDDPAQSPATNAAQRRWFKRMLCCALHHLVENETDLHAAELDRLRGEVERLTDALRLIELFGYREGKELGWINAHMLGVATSALEGQDLAPHWWLFPNHRARAAVKGETP